MDMDSWRSTPRTLLIERSPTEKTPRRIPTSVLSNNAPCTRALGVTLPGVVMQIGFTEILKTFAAAAVITVVGGIKVASEAASAFSTTHGKWVQAIATHMGISEFETLATQTPWAHWARTPVALAMAAVGSQPSLPAPDSIGVTAAAQFASAGCSDSLEPALLDAPAVNAPRTLARLTLEHPAPDVDQVEFVAELFACAKDASIAAACEDLNLDFDVNLTLDRDHAFTTASTGTFAWCPEARSNESAVRNVTFRKVIVCTASPANGQFAPLGRPLPPDRPRLQGMIRHDVLMPGRPLRVRSSPGLSVDASAREDLST